MVFWDFSCEILEVKILGMDSLTHTGKHLTNKKRITTMAKQACQVLTIRLHLLT